jgi:hypothetical protein
MIIVSLDEVRKWLLLVVDYRKWLLIMKMRKAELQKFYLLSRRERVHRLAFY